jgi:hypothetical protein
VTPPSFPCADGGEALVRPGRERLAREHGLDGCDECVRRRSLRRDGTRTHTSNSLRVVVLYVCRSGSSFRHPCRDAGEALNDAGHAFETRQVKGGIAKPWTWPSRAKDRAEIKRLSGQRGVPILVLDNGEVITGGSKIIEWPRINAQAN